MVELAQSTVAELVRRFPLQRVVHLEWRAYRTSAGTAHFPTNTIALSRRLLQNPDSLVRTVKHEFAHLLAFDRAGIRGTGHGAAWRQAMIDLGEDPKVHHDYDCQRNRPRQQAVYRCQRCQAMIHRARRLPRRRLYVHANCGGRLVLVEIRKIDDDSA